MKLICIADTHGYHAKLRLPAGDVLIHAGDMTARSGVDEVKDFLEWFGAQSHAHKILVAGNHDRLFENEPEMAAYLIPKSVTYLQDTSCIIMGRKIHGSPVTPAFMDWSFNRSRGRDIARHWKMIPDDTDILVTHGPAFGILDHNERGQNCGCEDLRKRVQAIQPKLHVFGHLHGGFGQAKLGRTQMVNAAICDDDYRPVNPPTVIIL